MQIFKITYYVPEADLAKTKQALFNAGAGAFGNYEHVCWQTKGMGQFKPLTGSHPAIGNTDQLSTIEEYKVEILCTKDCLESAIRALLVAHPYECPTIEWFQVSTPQCS